MKPVVILNHSEQACGVHQYGDRMARALSGSQKYQYHYRTADSREEADAIIGHYRPFAVIYNYHPIASPWLESYHLATWRGKVHLIGTAHDEFAGHFDYHVYGDPQFPSTATRLSVPRTVWVPKEQHRKPREVPVIGTFGLAVDRKDLETLVTMVAQGFDKAILRIHLPSAHFVDPLGYTATSMAEACRKIAPPNIELQITHEFLSEDELMAFLDYNDLNIFIYRESCGISSVLDYALGVDRPLAINESAMFQHMAPLFDEISVARNDLWTIMMRGTEPLREIKQAWSVDQVIKRYDEILDTIGDKQVNRVLTDTDRWYYEGTINKMFTLCHDMMCRKVSRANVQQAFVFETVRQKHDKAKPILAAGVYEDTAAESLKNLGYTIVGIDPEINMDLHTYHLSHPDEFFETILSTSVIEHVPDDELFIDDICQMLAPGGQAVITMDFYDGYRPGSPKPSSDVRLYTVDDMTSRLPAVLAQHGCSLVGEPHWEGAPDFVWEGVPYSFATFVFRKTAGS